MALWSHVDAGVDSMSIGVVVTAVMSTTREPVVLGWTWLGDAVPATWEAVVPSVSIGMDEVSFWHLVAGVWQ